MLSMTNISKVFRTDLIETNALRDFSLDVKAGEFLAVTGRVRFAEQPQALRQNHRAAVRIVLDERKDVLKVARSPFNDSETRFVYILRDDRAVRVPVEFGAAAIGEIEIHQGLAVGDVVVLSDMHDFKDAPSVLIGN